MQLDRYFNNIYRDAVLKYANRACHALFKTESMQSLSQLLTPVLNESVKAFAIQLFEPERTANYFGAPLDCFNGEGAAISLVLKFELPTEPDKRSLVTISVLDVTEQQLAQRKTNEALLRYELVVKGSTGAVWDWDIPAQTVHYSPQWAALRGRTSDEIGNHQDQWVTTIHPQDRARVITLVEAHFAGETDVFSAQYRILCKDGSFRWVADRGIAKRDDSGQVVRMAGSEIDITQQLEAEQRLRLGASVFENAAEGVMILNTQREIIDVNAAFCELQGCSVEHALTCRADDFLVDRFDDICCEEIWRELSTKSKWQGEMHNCCARGEVLPIWLTVSCVLDEDGELTHYVCLMTDISKIKKSEAMMYQLAHHDSLTGLPNRLLLNKRLAESISHSAENQRQLALIFIDLDNFKVINDGLGHAAGDQLLQSVASVLQQTVRARDTVARIGGDEFVVILQELNAVDAAAKVANKLLAQVSHQIELQGRSVGVTASLGVALYPCDGADADTLLSNADAAMYRAKALGKHNFQFYTQELTAKAMERMLLESSLKGALAQRQFSLFYQPQYDLRTRQLTGFEALIRWNHPDMGIIGPDTFIPLAEENGAIEDIGAWVIEEACRQASYWLRGGLSFETMAVNISCRQLLKGDLVAQIRRSLETVDLDPVHLEVEITESSVMQQPEKAIAQLNQLRELGIRLAIDDFGQGYSSLSQLKQLPINRLKIDKSFIQDISADCEDTAILEAMIAMAERMKLKIIAEGVETRTQEAFLLRNKCTIVQGYLYARPKPAAEIGLESLSI